MDTLGQKIGYMLLGAAIAAPLTWWLVSAQPVNSPASAMETYPDKSLPPANLANDTVEATVPTSTHTLAELNALRQQVQQLQGELAQTQTTARPEPPSEPPRSTASGNINRQLADIFQTELRDPLWADELELQLGDFLYTSDLSHYFAYASYGCKRHVCQLSFVPRSQGVDAMQWQRLNDRLFNTPWIQHFKVSAAQQTAQGMQVHLSTKSIRELSTEY
ncbi:hypothetical protein C3B51_22145 [Pseudoalteromonas rubra]|uniref:Uncharacterized protein n=1 Tax=Pseudoalteromonas rubra TaxID=43658 RepID=A0A4Q7DYM3_9GAMM|nr:hypothetical protein [Pseudoalteromonas rubra]RZM71910.1 hypothetical protein C3B51_22145 [Pseudoalteromonas rubra]